MSLRARLLFAWLFFSFGKAGFLPAEITPKNYVCYKLGPHEKIVIDGKIDDQAWSVVAFTEPFVDISTKVQPKFLTKAKMRFDNEYLYVAGFVQDNQIWANETKRNSVVFNDNDFEVFVDPDASTHYYKEFEMNARNTIWSLYLTKPYMNGGIPVNTMYNIKSAVYIDGVLNDPLANNKYWTVEIAFPLKSYVSNCTVARAPPHNNDIWRINFSRVEHKVKVVNNTYVKVANASLNNWVWSSQETINMHVPERWGFVQFSTQPVNSTKFVNNQQWNIRVCLAQVFYAESLFVAVNGYFTDDFKLLNLPRNCLDGSLSTSIPEIVLPTPYSFTVTITDLSKSVIGHIRNDRLFWFD